MTSSIRSFFRDERGQDSSIEGSLLIGLVVILGIAVFSGAGGGLRGMWAIGRERLTGALTALD
jgi:Flp pilus assembly pilin Flp